MGIPTKVLEQDERADAAIERDAATFGPESFSDGNEQIQISNDRADAKPKPQRDVQESRPLQDALEPSETRVVDGAEVKPGQDDAGKSEAEKLSRERQINASVLGRINAVMKPIKDENERLRARVETLEKEITTFRSGSQKKAMIDKVRASMSNGSQYDDDEILSLISAIKAVNEEEIPARVESIKGDLRAQKEADAMKDFVERLETRFPGFLALDSQDDSRLVAFLDSPVPKTGGRVTYRSLANDATKAMDFGAMCEVIEEFSAQSGVMFGSQGDNPRVKAQVRARPSHVKGQGEKESAPYFKQSDVKRFWKDLATGAIWDEPGMTKEAVTALRRDIENAEDNDRIIKDA